MKLLWLIPLLWCLPAWGVGAYVQQCTASGAVCTFGGATTTNNAIVFIVWVPSASDTISSVTNGSGFVTTNSGATAFLANSAWGGSQMTYSCSSSSATAFTVVTAAGTPGYIAGIEISGVDTTSCVDTFHTAICTSSCATTTDSGAASTTNGTDFLVGAEANNTANSATLGTDGQGHNYTNLVQGASLAVAMESQQESATNSYKATMGLTPSQVWSMHMIAFKAPTSSSKPPNQFPRVQ